jgi:hypothetical protein
MPMLDATRPPSTSDKIVPCESAPAPHRMERLCEACTRSVFANAADLRCIAAGARVVCWACAAKLFDQALGEIGRRQS